MAAYDQPTSLLALPQELRDHIYSYLLDPINATTEHPFNDCMPQPSRFKPYQTLRLVSKTISLDTKNYFQTHILPQLTFYFTSLPHLRHFQLYALQHPLLKETHFHIRCGSGTKPTTTTTTTTTTRRRPNLHPPPPPLTHTQQVEEIEALIRIQPGFPWPFTELPGFYRTRPTVQTNYGYFPATGPHAWKAHWWGIAVQRHTGGEVCDAAARCFVAGGGRVEVEVDEVQYPPLRQGEWDAGATPAGCLVGGERGSLRLGCFRWRTRGAREEAAVMVLSGRFADVWVPENVVQVDLKQKARRMR